MDGGGAVGEGSAPSAATGGKPPLRWFEGKALFWIPWPLLVALDLWSKHATFTWMEQQYGGEHGRHPVFVTEVLRFDLVTWENPGTIWGLFGDGTHALMVLRCLAVLGMLWFVASTPSSKRGMLGILSLIFAGAIGNLFDNFTRGDADPARSVRDFLFFSGQWPVAWDFPAFNVADSCITVGAICLLLTMLREDVASRKSKKAVSS
jgi:signal peptidase II